MAQCLNAYKCDIQASKFRKIFNYCFLKCYLLITETVIIIDWVGYWPKGDFVNVKM